MKWRRFTGRGGRTLSYSHTSHVTHSLRRLSNGNVYILLEIIIFEAMLRFFLSLKTTRKKKTENSWRLVCQRVQVDSLRCAGPPQTRCNSSSGTSSTRPVCISRIGYQDRALLCLRLHLCETYIYTKRHENFQLNLQYKTGEF